MKDPYEKERDQFLRELKDFSCGKRKKYPGRLAEPLYFEPKLWGRKSTDKRLTRAQHQEQLRYRQEITEEYRARWRLLCLLCGMDPVMPRSKAAWQELCRRLAVRHVPGLQTTNTPLQPRRRRGAPSTRGRDFFVELVEAVDEARARVAQKQKKALDEISTATAIRNLDRKYLDKWKTARGKPLSPATLETRYHEAIKMLKRATMVFRPLQELGKFYINSKPD
jgi:hypothetical protein